MTIQSDTYTAADTSWTVPFGVTSVTAQVVGAPGGNSSNGQRGGSGGVVWATFAVTAGQILRILVGSPGGNGATGAGGAGGAGSSAPGGAGTAGSLYGPGGGGGASYLRIQGDLAAVAAGGGGAAAADGARGALTLGSGTLSAGADGPSGSGAYGSGGAGGGAPGGTAAAGQPGGGGSSWIRGDGTDQAVYTGDPDTYRTAMVVLTYDLAVAPLAPTLISPPTGATTVRTATALVWQHNGQGEALAGSQVRYRLGSGSWVTSTISDDSQTLSLPSTLAAGSYEWQARTQNSTGGYGPWSESWFFTAASRPDAPTITGPTTAINPAGAISWAAPLQDAYQAQVLTMAGVVTASASGGASIRDTPVYNAFTDNGSTMQVRVRIRVAGVWSLWSVVTVPVDWDGPPAPSCTLTARPDVGAIDVAISAPQQAGLPAPVSVDVYITEAGVETRRAAGLPVASPSYATTWRYWTPPSGVVVAARVVALSTIGTTATSDVTT